MPPFRNPKVIYARAMNLNQNPTKEELKKLISSQDDDADHHMLWVSIDGDVFLDPVPIDLTSPRYAELLGTKMKFRLETLIAGNGYTGPDAAEDERWINRLYTALINNWRLRAQGYIDTF